VVDASLGPGDGRIGGTRVKAVVALTDQVRLKAVERMIPVDGHRVRILDRIVRLAAELVEAPIALLTLVEAHRQIFVAQTGLPADLATAGSTPIEYSICQHAVTRRRPLIVGDARTDLLLRDHPAVLSLGVMAYAGIPLITSDGDTVGTLCAIDMIPRDWTDDQLARLALLADVATDQLQLQYHERAAAFRQAWKGVPESTRW
jgi:GAF domain-containing protein